MATNELVTPFTTLAQHDGISRSLRGAYFEYNGNLRRNPNCPKEAFFLKFREALRPNYGHPGLLPSEFLPRNDLLPQEHLPTTLRLRSREVPPVILVAIELFSNALHGVAGGKLFTDQIMDSSLFGNQIEQKNAVLRTAFKAARGKG